MAIIKEAITYDATNYIAALAFFCVITCTILMLRLRGFKVTYSFTSNKNNNDYYENVPVVSSTNGAYKANREEFFGSGSFSDPPKKITPSMVKLPPPFQPDPTLRPTKSASNLAQQSNVPTNLRNSTPNVSTDPRGGTSNDRNSTAEVKKSNNKDAKKQEKEQKKIEKKRLDEQKKREKLAAQQQAKEEKIRKEKEKQEAQLRAKQAQQEAKMAQKQQKEATPAKAKNKNAKDKGKTEVTSQPPRANPLAQGPSQYSTNTLESSISKTSGPPAYSEVPKNDIIQNKKDNTGNTSFGKPVDNSVSSWDMISQHRQQMARPAVAATNKPKQMVMDLNYNTGRPSTSSDDDKNTAEA